MYVTEFEKNTVYIFTKNDIVIRYISLFLRSFQVQKHYTCILKQRKEKCVDVKQSLGWTKLVE